MGISHELRGYYFGRDNFLEDLQHVVGIFSKDRLPGLGLPPRFEIRTQRYHVELNDVLRLDSKR
jgi:hypothetical protein